MAKAIKVNADYESVIFQKKPSSKACETIEFLAFYLDSRPVLTNKIYSAEFLKHVETLSGFTPKTVPTGEAENWWGALKDIDLEKTLNSKITSFKLALQEGWTEGSIVSPEELKSISVTEAHLIKDPFGMSGRGFFKLIPGEELKVPFEFKSPVIIEPILKRRFDFSHYVFPDGKSIAYQNIVDERFTYKGSIIENKFKQDLKDLDFYSLIDKAHWADFIKQLSIIRDHYKEADQFGYSIDSFVYDEEGELLIHPLSEVNVRKTMGMVAYELCLRYGGDNPWGMLLLTSSHKDLGGHDYLNSKFQEEMEEKKVILLSPEDSRFDMFLLTAKSGEEGRALLENTGLLV